MTVSVITWLDEPWRGNATFDPALFIDPPPWKDPTAPTRLEVLAALICKNGGPIVHSWGTHFGGCAYGSSGLTQDEALALIGAFGFLCGIMEGTGFAHDHAIHMIKAEIKRVEALNELRAATSQERPRRK